MASNNYTKGLLKIQRGEIDYLNDDIQILVVDGTFTFNKAHEFVDDIVGELSGTGYSRKSLASKDIVSTTGTPDKIQFQAGSVEFTSIDAGTMVSVIVFKQVTNDSDSPLIANVDIPDIATNGSTVTIQFGSGTNVVFEAENPIT